MRVLAARGSRGCAQSERLDIRRFVPRSYYRTHIPHRQPCRGSGPPSTNLTKIIANSKSKIFAMCPLSALFYNQVFHRVVFFLEYKPFNTRGVTSSSKLVKTHRRFWETSPLPWHNNYLILKCDNMLRPRHNTTSMYNSVFN